MKISARPLFALIFLLCLAGILGWSVYQKLESSQSSVREKRQRVAAPVEVAPVEIGAIEQLRSFTGTLVARSEFLVASKISGRIKTLQLDLADSVKRGQLVAQLDDAEYVQDVARAQADLAIEKASYAEAVDQVEITKRELNRLEPIHQRGELSTSQLDVTRSLMIARRALIEVTRARIARAEAELESARIRLSYTTVKADWQGGNERRVVAQRLVDEGQTVAANAPLLRIVELNPITAVFFVTERDYAWLKIGQQVSIGTDAYPGQRFNGSVQRIAPVFSETTRQARVELLVENPERQLKPGMFVRASVKLQRIEDATIVPELALTQREDSEGVFIVDVDGKTARWHVIQAGIRQGGRVQLKGAKLSGQVVVLGQQLLDDGTELRIVETRK